MEQEVMKTVLQEILQELSGQRTELSHMQQGMEVLKNISTEIDGKLLNANTVRVALSDEQVNSIKELINEHFETLRGEIIKHPTLYTTHKHFSLLPLSFRMEHFPLLVNTVMKWVV
ncbi:MAG TPA: hypothetical protein VEY06_04415, partial [Flavisolibacter sp.]|nr:hypothetical protein [Flavisolibacter sp.]